MDNFFPKCHRDKANEPRNEKTPNDVPLNSSEISRFPVFKFFVCELIQYGRFPVLNRSFGICSRALRFSFSAMNEEICDKT